MKLSEQFIGEISQFDTIYCLVSGGYHSTASALLLKDNGFENVILLHNKTFLEMKSSINTISLLQQITYYEYFETTPNLKNETVWDIMKRSLQRIPEVIEDIKKDKTKYDRSKFECCRKLKKTPGKKYYQTLPLGSVVLSSICPFESSNRNRRLTELKRQNTFLRWHKTNNITYAYPFRDQRSEKPFLPYLRTKGFSKIEHSGCVICPILICFKIYNKRYYNTLKAMARAGMPCFQKTILDFLEV